MRTQKLSSGNFRIVISDGTDENGKRIFKSFTADAEWKAIKMAENYKSQQKQPQTAKKRQPRRTVPDMSYSRKGVTLAKAFRNYIIVKGTDSELPVLLAAWLSLRIGEVIGLQFRDVDREKHRIHVQRTIIHTKDGYEVRESCKTEKSDRCIHVPDYLLHLIMQQTFSSERERVDDLIDNYFSGIVSAENAGTKAALQP